MLKLFLEISLTLCTFKLFFPTGFPSDLNINSIKIDELDITLPIFTQDPKISERIKIYILSRAELLLPCPFTGPKMFCAGPNFLSQPKNLTAFSASSKTFVPSQKPILLNANHLLVWHKMFVTGTICKQIFGPTQKIWTSTKHFGTCKRTRQK